MFNLRNLMFGAFLYAALLLLVVGVAVVEQASMNVVVRLSIVLIGLVVFIVYLVGFRSK
jgi:hypothetical protein